MWADANSTNTTSADSSRAARIPGANERRHLVRALVVDPVDETCVVPECSVERRDIEGGGRIAARDPRGHIREDELIADPDIGSHREQDVSRFGPVRERQMVDGREPRPRQVEAPEITAEVGAETLGHLPRGPGRIAPRGGERERSDPFFFHRAQRLPLGAFQHAEDCVRACGELAVYASLAMLMGRDVKRYRVVNSTASRNRRADASVPKPSDSVCTEGESIACQAMPAFSAPHTADAVDNQRLTRSAAESTSEAAERILQPSNFRRHSQRERRIQAADGARRHAQLRGHHGHRLEAHLRAQHETIIEGRDDRW